MSNSSSDINFSPSEEKMESIKKYLTGLAERNYTIKQYLSTLNTQTKVAIIIVFICILIILYYLLIYKSTRIMSQKTFMIEIKNSPPAPHDARNPYQWTDPNNMESSQLSYIPSKQVDELDQTEYTISFWIYVRGSYSNDTNNDGNWSYRYGEWKHIMHKGMPLNNKGQTTLQSPGFWISPKMNRINCIIDTAQQKERIAVDDLPLNSWVNITTVLDSYSLSLYMNGRLERTITLRFNALSTKGKNIYITNGPQNKHGIPIGLGGFAGYMTFLQFYQTPLDPDKIYNIYTYFKKYIDKYNKYVIDNKIIAMPKLLAGEKY